jgi:VWFA-related protein
MNVSRTRFIIVLIVLGSYGASPLSFPAKAQEEESYRLSVDVELVVLHATVRDRNGRFVSDLGKQDFEVYEDGVLQSIRLFEYEDTPVTVGLVVDHSRSMSPKLAHVVAAGRAFVGSSNPLDQMFVVNFSDNVSLGLPAAVPFTNSAAEVEDAISNGPPAGMTALYEGIAEAIAQLGAGSHDKKVLLVISDGGDNASARNLAHVLKMAEISSTIVYTVGLFDDDDPDRNPRVLRRLAHRTGGEAFFPGELGAVVDVCESIAREIRNQYTIGYVSTNVAPDGAYRAIRVSARAPGDGKLVVRTRAGYSAGGESQPGDSQAAP